MRVAAIVLIVVVAAGLAYWVWLHIQSRRFQIQVPKLPLRRAWYSAGVGLISLGIIGGMAGGVAWAETEEPLVGYLFVAVGSGLFFWGIVCLVVYYLLNESAKRAVRHEELMARLAAPQSQSPTTAQATGAVHDNDHAMSAPASDPVASVAHGHQDVLPQALIADELTKLGSLLEKGLVTRDEFERQKKVLLGVGPEPGTDVPSAGEKLPALVESTIEASKEPAGLPNVVGKGFDVAVSAMWSAGFRQIQYSDATGQRRQPTTRSDWVVIGQRPNPGTDPAKDEPVILGVKLIGE